MKEWLFIINPKKYEIYNNSNFERSNKISLTLIFIKNLRKKIISKKGKSLYYLYL